MFERQAKRRRIHEASQRGPLYLLSEVASHEEKITVSASNTSEDILNPISGPTLEKALQSIDQQNPIKALELLEQAQHENYRLMEKTIGLKCPTISWALWAEQLHLLIGMSECALRMAKTPWILYQINAKDLTNSILFYKMSGGAMSPYMESFLQSQKDLSLRDSYLKRYAQVVEHLFFKKKSHSSSSSSVEKTNTKIELEQQSTKPSLKRK
jgi:hypothetical protein